MCHQSKPEQDRAKKVASKVTMKITKSDKSTQTEYDPGSPEFLPDKYGLSCDMFHLYADGMGGMKTNPTAFYKWADYVHQLCQKDN